MKLKLLYVLLALLVGGGNVAFSQESELALTTDLPVGSEFTFNPTLFSGSVEVDWGDGNRVQEEIQKNSWGGTIGYVGTVKGSEIHIYGKFTRIDLNKKELTSVKVVSQPNLTFLSLSDNKLTGRPGYDNSVTDLSGAPNLTYLDVSKNNLEWLYLKDFKYLESLYASENPQLNSIYLCDEDKKQESITTINASNCDIPHFWPRNLPNLGTLNLSGNDLMDIEIGDHYPELWSLNLSDNPYLEAVDLSKCTELMSLSVSNTKISTLNLSQCPDLEQLYADGTQLTKLNLKANTIMRVLSLKNTQISELDVSQMEALRSVYVDNTKLKRLDLRMKRYLQYVSIAGTDIEWLDLHHCVGYNTLRSLDLRNCKKMTKQTLNYTFDALPPHNGASYQKNVFLEGTAYEHACTDLLDLDGDNYYLPDFEGDGKAADLKEEVTLTELATTGGTYKLQKQEQWGSSGDMPEWGSYSQYLPFVDITGNKVWAGRPVRVTNIVPEEGYEFAGVEVNGVFIADNEFQLSANGTVKVIFRGASNADVIKLTVPAGVSQQYFLGADEEGTQITVDWGDGTPIEYTIGTGHTYVGVDELDGQTTSGTTVTIKGAVTRAIFDSYPFVATDNLITAIDLSGTTHLRELSTYMNEIETIDVSNQPDLEILDVSYSELDELNIGNNPKLTRLLAYGNYLTTLDLSTAPGLEYLDVKGNLLASLDLSANTKIDTLKVQNNELTALDVAGLTKLEQLEAWGNEIAAIDVTNAPNLYELNVSGNQLTKLDITNNPYLLLLNVSGNHLDALNASKNPWLCSVNVSKNGWSACTLDDFFTSLQEYPLTDEQKEQTGLTGITLRLDSYFYGSGYEANAYQTSTTSLATDKGWVVDYEGDGTGCPQEDAIEGINADAQNGAVVVYDLQGRRMPADSRLTKGIYVVKQNGKSKTVLVK